MKTRIAGLAVQTLIWLIIYYLYANGKNIFTFPNYLISIVLFASLFVYFNEFLFKSKLYCILSKKIKVVQKRYDIIKKLTSAQLFLEIHTKAFHYSRGLEIPSYDRVSTFEFTDVKDMSSVKMMPLFFEETRSLMNDQLIVVDLDLTTKFMDHSCEDELEGCLSKIKNDASFKDKYCDSKKRYILKGLKKEDNVFTINSEHTPVLNKGFFIASYLFLVGEIFKMYLESYIVSFKIELVKVISRVHANNRIGSLVNVNYSIESYDEYYDLVEEYEYEPANTSAANGENYHDDFYIKARSPPKIDNYDPVFNNNSSLLPMLSSKSNKNAYIDFNERVSTENEKDKDKETAHLIEVQSPASNSKTRNSFGNISFGPGRASINEFDRSEFVIPRFATNRESLRKEDLSGEYRNIAIKANFRDSSGGSPKEGNIGDYDSNKFFESRGDTPRQTETNLSVGDSSIQNVPALAIKNLKSVDKGQKSKADSNVFSKDSDSGGEDIKLKSNISPRFSSFNEEDLRAVREDWDREEKLKKEKEAKMEMEKQRKLKEKAELEERDRKRDQARLAKEKEDRELKAKLRDAKGVLQKKSPIITSVSSNVGDEGGEEYGGEEEQEDYSGNADNIAFFDEAPPTKKQRITSFSSSARRMSKTSKTSMASKKSLGKKK